MGLASSEGSDGGSPLGRSISEAGAPRQGIPSQGADSSSSSCAGGGGGDNAATLRRSISHPARASCSSSVAGSQSSMHGGGSFGDDSSALGSGVVGADGVTAAAAPGDLDTEVGGATPLTCSARDGSNSSTGMTEAALPSAAAAAAVDTCGSSSNGGESRNIETGKSIMVVDVPESPSTPGKHAGVQLLKEAFEHPVATAFGPGPAGLSSTASSPRSACAGKGSGDEGPVTAAVQSAGTTRAPWVLRNSSSSSSSSNALVGKGTSGVIEKVGVCTSGEVIPMEELGKGSGSRKGAGRQLSIDKQAVLEAVNVMEDTLRVLQEALTPAR